MDPSRPTTVRYYDARRTRPWFVVGMVVVALVAASGIWAGTGLLRADTPAQTGVVTVEGDVIDPAAADAGGLRPVDTAVAVQDDPAAATSQATSMAMVGDSITAASDDAIRSTLMADGFTAIDIDAVVSRRIIEGNGRKGTPSSGVSAVDAILRDPEITPDVWVVALGTNDVGQYTEPEEYRRLVETVVGMIPAEIPLVWVDTYRWDHRDASIEFNEILVETLRQRGSAVVASWHEQASRNAETRVLRDDGVHPNEHGRVVFAALVAEGIAAVT